MLGFAFGLISLFQFFKPRAIETLPRWFGVALCLVGLSLAQFLTYHELRLRYPNQPDPLFAGLWLSNIDTNLAQSVAEFSLVFRNTTPVPLRYEIQDVKVVINQTEISKLHVPPKSGVIAAGQQFIHRINAWGFTPPLMDIDIGYTLTYGPAEGKQMFKSHRLFEATSTLAQGQVSWTIVEQEDSRLRNE